MARKKQTEVPGTERESDPEIDAAAADVYELTAERLDIQEREKGARAKLLDLMTKKNLEIYVYEDGEERYDVRRKETIKVSVKKAKNRKADEE
jgi:hypothetical protein